MEDPQDVAGKAGMRDEAVRARTGRGWSQWLSILDAAGASEMDHRRIAQYLQQEHNVPAWWSQTITVGYERARGLREKHQVSSGFRVSASKTVNAPVGQVFGAWADAGFRARWLGEARLTPRAAVPGKTLRFTWDEDQTSVEVSFYPRGDSRSQVVIQHSRLASQEDVERRRLVWKSVLERMRAQVVRVTAGPPGCRS